MTASMEGRVPSRPLGGSATQLFEVELETPKRAPSSKHHSDNGGSSSTSTTSIRPIQVGEMELAPPWGRALVEGELVAQGTLILTKNCRLTKVGLWRAEFHLGHLAAAQHNFSRWNSKLQNGHQALSTTRTMEGRVPPRPLLSGQSKWARWNSPLQKRASAYRNSQQKRQPRLPFLSS